MSRHVRRLGDLRPAKKGRKLPRILTADDFRRFYRVVDQADDAQHGLMLRLLFYTGARVSELCRIEVADVDLENCKIFVSQGKGDKDRYVLFGKGFATALRTHLAAHRHNRYLFQTRRATKFSTRRVEQIVQKYAEEAGVRCHPAQLPPPVHHLVDEALGHGRCRVAANHRAFPARNFGDLPACGARR